MKTIKVLIPLDDSAFSRQALEVASTTLNPGVTEVCLLRVSANPVLPDGAPTPPAIHGGLVSPTDVRVRPEPHRPPIYLDELRASIKADFKRQFAKDVSRLEDKGFTVTTEVRFGDAATEIVTEAQRNYDMIVMTTHGRSGLSRMLMGSVAEKVMRNASIPVMMFKPEGKTAAEAA